MYIYIYIYLKYFENREKEGDKSIYTMFYLPDLFEESDPMYTKSQDKQLCQVLVLEVSFGSMKQSQQV